MASNAFVPVFGVSAENFRDTDASIDDIALALLQPYDKASIASTVSTHNLHAEVTLRMLQRIGLGYESSTCVILYDSREGSSVSVSKMHMSAIDEFRNGGQVLCDYSGPALPPDIAEGASPEVARDMAVQHSILQSVKRMVSQDLAYTVLWSDAMADSTKFLVLMNEPLLDWIKFEFSVHESLAFSMALRIARFCDVAVPSDAMRQIAALIPRRRLLQLTLAYRSRECAVCSNKPSQGCKVASCSRCRSRWYCPGCQKGDWKEHKKTCSPATQPAMDHDIGPFLDFVEIWRHLP